MLINSGSQMGTNFLFNVFSVIYLDLYISSFAIPAFNYNLYALHTIFEIHFVLR